MSGLASPPHARGDSHEQNGPLGSSCGLKNLPIENNVAREKTWYWGDVKRQNNVATHSSCLGTVLQAEKSGLKMLGINSIKITSDIDDLKVFTRHYT